MQLELVDIGRPGWSFAFRYRSPELQERVNAELRASVPPFLNLVLSPEGFLGPAGWDYRTARDARAAGRHVVSLEMFTLLHLKESGIRASYDQWRKIQNYYAPDYRLHDSITCLSHELLDTDGHRYATLTVFVQLGRITRWPLVETLAQARGTVHFRYQPVEAAVPASSAHKLN